MPSWGWKRADSPEDAHRFINGLEPYRRPVSNAKIAAVRGPSGPIFFISYQRGPTKGDRGFGSWGWKRAESPDDAHAFINGQGPYRHPVHDFEIVIAEVGAQRVFYVFYTRSGPTDGIGGWGWTRRATAAGVVEMLDGRAFGRAIKSARIAALDTSEPSPHREVPRPEDGGREREYFVFYQTAGPGSIDNWQHQQVDEADEIDDASDPPAFEVCGMTVGSQVRFDVFRHHGTRLWPMSPLHDERFVVGEPVSLRALLTSERPHSGRAITWQSDLDGHLGSGPSATVPSLSVGTHQITVSGHGASTTIPVRVFEDLGAFYQAAPAAGEIERILGDFEFVWVDGTGTDETWAPYDDFAFDQSSTDPSNVVVVARLDVLRHQRFAAPIPIPGATSFYDYLRTHVRTFRMHLSCGFNTGGGGTMNLRRSSSVWDGRSSSTAENPDACKTPHDSPTLYPYIYGLQLLIHEGRHSDPADIGHSNCGDGGAYRFDEIFEPGSGYAFGALYSMWVHEHSLHDPPEIREAARSMATTLLSDRFCSPPSHSDPAVQAIIDDLLEA